ncbi:hypothetical protein B0J12DRAFT_572412 [Macrophomina phaseolina]|uniref:DUF7703 domain-containing protein n=1 Tax=Macrophomina phaseolina TaxID=35725 RepID=A0ABQ8GDM2_9PEZI|nr:hypothetical protein B0J12DRAFT_572412 [Macrophomina phaseolina]
MSQERPPYGLSLVMLGFLSIAFFNGIEVLVKVYFTFRRHRGLYFWSIVTATIGIYLYVIGFGTKFFIKRPGSGWVGLAFVIAGWIPMISCQSLALYSRLHLVMRRKRRLRYVFYMILGNAAVFHTPIAVLIFLAETSPARAAVYTAYEKAELTAFSVQECIISGLYIWETWKILKPPKAASSPLASARHMHSIRCHVIYVNLIVVALDATLLAAQFSNHYRVQTTYKAFVYSVKLKLEFAILNRLIAATKSRRGGKGAIGAGSDPPSAEVFDGTSCSTRLGSLQPTGMSKTAGASMQATAAVSCSAHHPKVVEEDEEAALSVVVEENAVMKTTEVRIESHGRDEEIGRQDHVRASQGSFAESSLGSSRASSEVRFATAGF